ncbi:STAS/SEC14 domain-containing protein [Salipaludibacillus sp. CUR1]|uniref:STAS/SEC14 domain-containing protein n=1 Tax=Salipaludibacillus sp. CUR1 TaxID=2820003 RepID=UPI001E31CB56|nr:STAS/SEC14 domain-containing protein [Salipaludibacillus sp. CUR1]MCE7794445.1 STAS/SEC14 domain-containing protein [Salipaludibacillus sp. CUR1]
MIRELSVSEGNFIAFEVTENVSEEEFGDASDKMKELIGKYGKIRLMVRFPELPIQDVSSINNRFKFIKNNFNDIEKYAVVTDKNIFNIAAAIVDTASETDVQRFSADDLEKAVKWVKS